MTLLKVEELGSCCYTTALKADTLKVAQFQDFKIKYAVAQPVTLSQQSNVLDQNEKKWAKQNRNKVYDKIWTNI